MRLNGIYDRQSAVWRVVAALALLCAFGTSMVASASDLAAEKTPLGSVPWDPASLSAGAGDNKAIFGTDDRIDVYQETDARHLQWAASVCALVDANYIHPTPDGNYTMQMFEYSYYGIPLCEDQAFANQPAGAFCTGFMVGPDLIATAGHCTYDLEECELSDLNSYRFVFGFVMTDESSPVFYFSEDQVYTPAEIISSHFDNCNVGGEDYAIVRVDRPITAPNAVPFEIRREGVVENGANVGVIGHPYGLPMKIAFGETTTVTDNAPSVIGAAQPDMHFRTNIDAFQGNSGSPVINAATGVVEGIFVTVYLPEFLLNGECVAYNVWDDDDVARASVCEKTTRFKKYVPENGLMQGNFNFRATAVLTEGGDTAIALTWDNPSSDFMRATVLRSPLEFVTDITTGSQIYQGRDTAFLDTSIQEGVEYFYTLIITKNVNSFQVNLADFAREIADATPTRVWTEGFGDFTVMGNVPKTFDLSYKQILFSPTGKPGAPLGVNAQKGGYRGYTASLCNDAITEFPVPREDMRGSATTLALNNNAGILVSLNDWVFPFFGTNYTQLFLAENGYISMEEIPVTDDANFPGIASHFSTPRISFLFSNLSCTTQGEIWARFLDDRMVLTFEDIINATSTPGSEEKDMPATNSVQVELFQSGHIRCTYLGVSAEDAIVGLSNGSGVPLDPSTIFDGETEGDEEEIEVQDGNIEYTDFSSLPNQPEQLTMSFETSAANMIHASGGDTVRFNVAVNTPAGLATPTLVAEWTSLGLPPFTDNGDGTGTFEWISDKNDSGIYIVRITARSGDEQAYQDVRINMGAALILPEVYDLEISTLLETEDPRQSRPVDDDQPLFANYLYSHCWGFEDSSNYSEGSSLIYWYRNGQIAPALTGLKTVPPNATEPGDEWYFMVTPVTKLSLAGEPAISPIVTIVAAPTILNISPNTGDIHGGETITITGTRLSPAPVVRFGGVEAAGVTVINANELEVVTPLHSSGVVDITVETVAGTGRLVNAYTYVDLNPDPDPEPVKFLAMLGCGPANGQSGLGGDAAVALLCIAGVAVAARRKARSAR